MGRLVWAAIRTVTEDLRVGHGERPAPPTSQVAEEPTQIRPVPLLGVDLRRRRSREPPSAGLRRLLRRRGTRPPRLRHALSRRATPPDRRNRLDLRGPASDRGRLVSVSLPRRALRPPACVHPAEPLR